VVAATEETMLKLTTAIILVATPVFAQTTAVVPVDCPPIGQSAKGELIYGMDCAALKAENRMEVLPNMPQTNLKDTVIPKSGKVQTPDTTPTTGVNK
jgi:hypothetical protein